MKARWCSVIMSLALASIPQLAAQESPRFSARATAVRVDVLVTDNGRRVDGLTAADFEIRDNGVMQKVELASGEQTPVNVIIALDVSESVTGVRLKDLQGASRTILNTLKAGDRAGLVTFSHAITVHQSLTADTRRIADALETLKPAGLTSLTDGTYVAMLAAEPDALARNLVLVFSDGADTASWLTSERVVESARRSDVTVYAVAVRGAERDFLRDVTAVTGGTVFEIGSTRDLSATFSQVFEEFRRRYVLSYSPTGVTRGGWHKLQVRVKGRRADVRARQTYYGGP